MKSFVVSNIFRKMTILAILVSGTFFVTVTGKVNAMDNDCCSFCNHLYIYCAQFVYPNDIYETSWDCIVDHGGEDCEVCNPTC